MKLEEFLINKKIHYYDGSIMHIIGIDDQTVIFKINIDNYTNKMPLRILMLHIIHSPDKNLYKECLKLFPEYFI